MIRLGPFAAALALLVAPTVSAGRPNSPAPVSPTLAGCPVLPPDNSFNQRVDRLPVARNSARTIARIGLGAPVHPDFGTVYDGAPNGIPFAVVDAGTRAVSVRFTYAGESDPGPYPLPAHVPIEGGAASTGDRHVIVLDRATCTDYELYDAHPIRGGRAGCPPARQPASPDRVAHASACWTAGSGAIFHLRSDRLRPAGWTSADAAGLPILPGLARYGEVKAGTIDHALRFTAPCTAPRYVYPARHEASTCQAPDAPPMGLRVRLKASVDISRLPYQARVVAHALKRYGLILADNGSPWYISGAPDPHWSDDALHQLARLSGRDFQVVDTSSLPHPGR